MRKAVSAPCLLALGQRGVHQQSESDNEVPGRQRRAAASHLRRTSLPQRTKRPRRRAAAAWLLAEAPDAPLAQAEEIVIESSFPRGLASEECFMLYGTRQAPGLAGHADDQDAALAELHNPDGTTERLAACLATPFTGDERNLGEIVDEHVRRAVNEVEANTQLRYAVEVQLEQEARSPDSEQVPRQLTVSSRRLSRRRRDSERLLLEAFLAQQEQPAPPPGPAPPSPTTRSVMDSMFASLDDCGPNRLVIDAKPADMPTGPAAAAAAAEALPAHLLVMPEPELHEPAHGEEPGLPSWSSMPEFERPAWVLEARLARPSLYGHAHGLRM